MNIITCTSCGAPIEIDKALEGQIEARVLAAEQHKHQEELEAVRREFALRAEKAAAGAGELARREAAEELELAKARLEADSRSAQRKSAAAQELLVKSLQDDAEAEKAANKQLREQLSELMKSLREEKQARANADLDAQRKLAAEEGRIREEAVRSADEKYHLKIAEQEKKLADTQKALDDAQRKAGQGSQQNQGEVLELDLEQKLRDAYPSDSFAEVKKGQRGADLKHTVNSATGVPCGTLLWETKNGKWQPAWIAKFKADIREAGASMGVLVSQEIPAELGDIGTIEQNLWVVSPRLAPALASALRGTLLQVAAANAMSAGKDAKMESLYQFLVGPEFRHRVEAIVENYTVLQEEIEREKRAAALKWARQEKAIRAVIDNTIGMYGDFQGITMQALPVIKSLELEGGE